MAVPKSVVNFETGETLTPDKLNKGFEQIYKDIVACSNKKYAYSRIYLDFSGVSDTFSGGELDNYLNTSNIELMFMELVLYQATGNITSVTLSCFGGISENNPTVTVSPAGATTRSRSIKPIIYYGVDTVSLSVSASATPWTLGRCYAILHCRQEVPGVSDFSERSAPRFSSGESVSAGKLNTAFSDYETELAAITTQLPRFSIYTWRNIPSSIPNSDRDIRIPSTGRTFSAIRVEQEYNPGNEITATLLDETGATVISVDRDDGTTAVNDTQTETDAATDPNLDYKLRISRVGASTVPVVHVLLWET